MAWIDTRAFGAVGYPAHDIIMTGVDGKSVGSCGGPLVLPAQAGVRAPPNVLYCPKHKLFLIGDGIRLQGAREAAIAEGFSEVGLDLVDMLSLLAAKSRRAPLDKTKVTINMFTEPQHHAKVGPDGRAR